MSADTLHNDINLNNETSSKTIVSEEIYLAGLAEMEHFNYECAATYFRKIPGYKNADELVRKAAMEAIVVHIKAKRTIEAEEQKDATSNRLLKKLSLKGIRITIASLIVICILAIGVNVTYHHITNFQNEKTAYQQAVGLLQAGKPFEADFAFHKAWGYRDAEQKCIIIDNFLDGIVSAGGNHTVAVKSDGTVMSTGSNSTGQRNVTNWKNITAIAAGYDCTVAIKQDGTATVVGNNSSGQLDLQGWEDLSVLKNAVTNPKQMNFNFGDGSDKHWYLCDWKDLVAVAAGADHVVGLKKDGSVLAVGRNDYGQCRVFDWSNIEAISAGANFTIGLKTNGTVVATGNNSQGQCNTSYWENIVAISAGDAHTVGLCKDGTVVAIGKNNVNQCNTEGWKNIVAVSAGNDFTVGLRKDGTVVACGNLLKSRSCVSGWEDIIAIYAGGQHIIGLNKDGNLVAAGDNMSGQCNVTKWSGLSQNLSMNSVIAGLDTSGLPTYLALDGAGFLGNNLFLPQG